jgi:hypothetical protein
VRRPLPFAIAALGATLLACAPKPVPFTARLVTQSCMGPSPMEGVTHFRFQVTGDGMAPVVVVAPINAHTQTLPDLPVGRHRVLEVRGYAGDPATSGQVISVGRTLPFEVPSVAPADGSAGVLRVMLRRVNVFEPPNLASAPTQCTQLTEPRAGQSATLLSDGRVFIAGGYRLDGRGGVQTLASSELYDPSTGAFMPGPDVGVSDSQQTFVPSPRAFHTATLLPGDQVLLAGGEVQSDGGTTVLASALVFDPLSHVYGALTLHAARTHHAAAADASGHVLLVGGVDGSGAAVASPEGYDASTGTSRLLPVSLPRIGAVATAVGDGSTIAVVGGTDGTTLALDVPFFGFDGTALSLLGAHVTLHEGRRSAGVAPFQDAGAALVVGGYAEADPTQTFTAVASTEVIEGGATPSLVPGPAIGGRGDLCAAALAGGQVLTAGGRTVSFDGQALATDDAELVTVTPNGDTTTLGMPPLPAPRWQHTCTALGDGSVLILGGVNEAGVLQDAVIFMPAP